MSDTGELIDGIKANIKTEVITVGKTDEGEDINVVAHSVGDSGVRLTAVKEFIDIYRKKPAVISGSSVHTDIVSFADHINRFKAVNSVIFADTQGLSLRAIYDYHVQYGVAENLRHQAKFAPKQSRQLGVWRLKNATPMNQAAFADFIENNILDLCDAPAEGAAIAEKLGTKVASPSKLLELARGLSIHEASTVKSHVNTTTGEVTLEYITAHSDSTGKKLCLPGMFCIGIPVFEGGDLYRVMVRLRYRIADGKATWWYELYQLEQCIEDAFNEIIDEALAKTCLQIYRGTAEG